ncbi:MAG: alpha/beta hydrolase [Myxococcota bacterium]|nr:alpha/beta hydrolase [Myxococcota bacterium]
MARPAAQLRLTGAISALIALLRPSSYKADEPAHPDVSYLREQAPADPTSLADIYIPPGVKPTRGWPSVLLVHGGGFVVGSRRMKPVRFLGSELSRAGYLVFVPGYRQLPGGASYPEMHQQIRKAFAFWMERGTSFGASPGQCTILGKSAGSAIAMRAAEGLPDNSVCRFISLFGLHDLNEQRGLLGRAIPRRLLPEGPQSAAAESPLERPPLPFPLTLIHGCEDRLVPYAQAVDMLERRRQSGADVELISYEGAGHGWFNDENSELSQLSLRDLLGVLGR